jgi:tRNA G46 methylase TrmB
MNDESEDENSGFQFLNSFEDAVDDSDENGVATETKHSDDQSQGVTYNSRKPRWWKNLCGKASKAQKRSIAEVMKNHELKCVPYGCFVAWEEVFPKGMEIWLEIGYGRGENLLANAHQKRNENIALVGAEISNTGVGTACQRIEQGVASNSFWTGYNSYSPEKAPSESPPDEASEPSQAPNFRSYEPVISEEIMPYKKLRIYQGDGAKFLPKIQTSSIAAVLVTFPDPFPDKDQAQWRILQVHTIREMHRILKKTTGTLFLATDHLGFFEWSHEVMGQFNEADQYFKEIDPPPDRMEWLPAISHYEEKGWNEGRRTFMTFWQAVPVQSEAT